MAKDFLEENEEKAPAGRFERFLFIVTPIVFMVILLAILLTLLNDNWRSSFMKWAADVPVINLLVPAAEKETIKKEASEQEVATVASAQDVKESLEKQVADLKELLTSKDNDLRALSDKRKDLESEVARLTKQLDQIQTQQEIETVTKEQYESQIKDIADMFGKMMPNKAAPILQNWTTEEMVLIMQEMKQEQRIKLLEKMDPTIAADVSIAMKDAALTEDAEVAALQARLKKQEKEDTPSKKLNIDQLAKTFSNMSTESGASLLLETAKSDQGRAVTILQAVTDEKRSALLETMMEKDKDLTVKLTSKLQ